MLIIPIDRKLDWHNVPVVTLLLILTNAFVYFTFQSDEDAKMEQAVDYYFEQGLDQIELPAYQAEMEAQGGSSSREEGAEEPNAEKEPIEWLIEMQFDAPFMARLRGEEIITPEHERYHEWLFARRQFDARFESVPTFDLGLKGGAFAVEDLIAHMFLHGSVMHLVGNMLFLFAVGFMVEAALGHWSYLAAYLLSGVIAATPDLVMHTNTLMPSIGASGAIAGMMGLYAVLFGLRRVRFFYFIGVYFDYVRAPAIVLFVLWLGNEIYQQITWSDYTNVNYLAHIAGLIAGGSIAVFFRLQPRLINMAYLESGKEVENKTLSVELAGIEGDIAALRYDAAAERLRKLYEQGDGDALLLPRVYACSKYQPTSETFHWAASHIFLAGDSLAGDEVRDTYRDYIARARPRARLGRREIDALVTRFLVLGELDEAERLMAVMLRNRGHFPNVPDHLLQMSKLLNKAGKGHRSRDYLSRLLQLYPDTPQAAVARDLLG